MARRTTFHPVPFLATALLVAFLAPAAGAVQGGRLVLPAVTLDASTLTSVAQATHPGTGLLTFLAAPRGTAFLVEGLPAAADPEAAARRFLQAEGARFGIARQADELILLRVAQRPLGQRAVRFRQFHGGIPVLGGEVVVNLDAALNVETVNGETVPLEGAPTEPAIGAGAAVAAAVAEVAGAHGLPGESLTASDPELWYYNPVVFWDDRFENRLVWRVEVAAGGQRPIREMVLVDALDGSVPLHFNTIDTAAAARDRATYTMGGSDVYASLPGTLVCDEADPACAAGDTDARSAHQYAGDTYDYYLSRLGRDGIDGAGMTIVSSVHFGVGYQNAFWNGVQMVYGDGFSAADDVVGHEIAHGVMEKTANLFYFWESGAINESYSDVFGELIDQGNGSGSDGPSDRWYVGEDIPGIGSIRNMANPPEFGDPDRIGSPNYFKGFFDNGGVHINSGVSNKAAYLMTDGGMFNGHLVIGIGADKVAGLYYDALTSRLTSASNYADLNLALQASCDSLAAGGIYGFTEFDCTEVEKALLAVEMHIRPGQYAVDDSSDQVSYSGAWNRVDDGDCMTLYCGYHLLTARTGSVSIPFTGRRATIYYLPGPGFGFLDVYLDTTGTKVASINQDATANPYSWAYELTGLPSGNHTLILKKRGGSGVTLDAVVFNQNATLLPAIPKSYFPTGVWYSDFSQWLTYRGYWNVGYPSWSMGTGDTLAYSFKGVNFSIAFFGRRTDKRLGEMEIILDGRSLGSISQRTKKTAVWYIYLNADIPNRKHSVVIRHKSGRYINVVGVAGYKPGALAAGVSAGNGELVVGRGLPLP
jgi:Zn-dependent metalloprotease